MKYFKSYSSLGLLLLICAAGIIFWPSKPPASEPEKLEIVHRISERSAQTRRSQRESTTEHLTHPRPDSSLWSNPEGAGGKETPIVATTEKERELQDIVHHVATFTENGEVTIDQDQMNLAAPRIAQLEGEIEGEKISNLLASLSDESLSEVKEAKELLIAAEKNGWSGYQTQLIRMKRNLQALESN